MHWNWQQNDWPNFTTDCTRLAKAEQQFLVGGGVILGSTNHLGSEERTQFKIEAISNEAMATSEIEGEILDRASVQFPAETSLGLPPSIDVWLRANMASQRFWLTFTGPLMPRSYRKRYLPGIRW